MNKLILLFLSLFLFSGCSKIDRTVDWKIYYKTEGETILIDQNSIKKKDNYVSFWYVSRLRFWGDTNFLWKKVYDCKKRKSMSLYYEVVPTIETLPKNIPDLTDEDRWLDISYDFWDSDVFGKLCVDNIKKTYF